MELTDAIVAGLKVPVGKTEHFWWDSHLPGFGVRGRQASNQAAPALRWYIQYRLADRQQRRESLGDVRKIKSEAARKIARQRFAQVELGQDPAAMREQAKEQAAAAKLKFELVADRYLAIKRDTLRPTSHQAAERYLREHWKGLRHLPISAVARAHVAPILQEITIARGRVSAARARSNLSALFSWAMKEGLCEANPVIATNDPARGIPARERVLDDAEIKVIWDACPHDRFGKIIKLLLLCGARREEIGGLRWSEIDLNTGILIIPGERTKSRKALILTLAAPALEILRSVPRHDGQEFVFGRRARGFSYSYAMLGLSNRIAAAIGRPLPHWTLHDLRRTARSGLGRLGVAPHVAELVIGHHAQGVTAIYDRYRYEAEIKAALAVWAEHLIAVVEGRSAQVVPLRA